MGATNKKSHYLYLTIGSRSLCSLLISIYNVENYLEYCPLGWTGQRRIASNKPF
jgi:hypothetical protein